MANKNPNLNVIVSAETKPLEDGFKRAGSAMSQFSAKSRSTLGESGRYFNKFSSGVNSSSFAIEGLKANLSAVGAIAAGALSTRAIIRYSDTWKTLEGRLSIVTKTSEELVATQDELFRIAQLTRNPLESVSNLYQRMAQALTPLQRETVNISGITETFSKALAITGESAASAQGAVLQFTQAVSSDFKNSGQELNSIIDQSPRVAQAIAAGMGVAVGGLKDLSKAGALTRDLIFDILDPLSEQGKKIGKEFEKIPTTVARALTTLDNAMLRYVGLSELADAGTGVLAASIQTVANNFEELANIAIGVGGALAVRAIAPMVMQFKAALVAHAAFANSILIGQVPLLAADRAAIALATSTLALATAEYENTKALIIKNKAIVANITAEGLQAGSRTRLKNATKALVALEAALPISLARQGAAQEALTATTKTSVATFGKLGSAIRLALISPTGLGLLALGLYELEQRTGLLSTAFGFLKESVVAAGEAMGIFTGEFGVFDGALDQSGDKIDDLMEKIKRIKSENENRNARFPQVSTKELEKELVLAQAEFKAILAARSRYATKDYRDSISSPGGGGGGAAAGGGTAEKDKFAETIKGLEEEAELLRIQVKLFDEKDSAIQREQEQLKITNKLREQGRELSDSEVETLEARLDAIEKESNALEGLEKIKKDAEELEKKRAKAVEEYANAFESSFEDAILSGEKLSDVLQGLLEDILKIAIRTSITRPLAEGVGNFFKDGGGSGILSGAGDFLGDLFSFDVGTNNVPRDMTANIHKGEMIIPAYDAQKMRNGSFGGGAGVVVNITNTSGANVKTSSSKNSNGIELSVMIDKAVADHISTQGSKTNQALSNFNSRTTVRR